MILSYDDAAYLYHACAHIARNGVRISFTTGTWYAEFGRGVSGDVFFVQYLGVSESYESLEAFAETYGLGV